MKIAAAQIFCQLGDVEANLRKIRDFCSRAKAAGAELVVFPEVADTGYSMPIIANHATGWKDGAVSKLQEFAQSLSIGIVCGVAERDGACIYNAQVAIDSGGKIIGKYRKTHLFTSPAIDEHECFSAGAEFSGFELGGLSFGLSICYDIRFPELYRILAIRDRATIFVVSSAWPFPRIEHLRVLGLARAIENQSYVVLANRAGTDERTTFCGSSAIIDPYGVVIAAASTDREELIYGDISDTVIATTRSRMTVYEHRRPELYRDPSA